ncbi:MAG: response regulator transcription factor [Rhizobiaceae bacterium]|nr:MAG: response regulator transcription factor [Rhizobiaceae bacterium]CAG1013679.1 Transcriptional regulatory protein OmpR [Rhizobiaceae bacterium]
MAARAVVVLVGLPEARDGLGEYLERRGYDIHIAGETWEADTILSGGGVDVAVLDLETGDGTGLDLLRRHGGGNGATFVTVGASGNLIDRILALELGAADALDRPLDRRELAARIGGLIARGGRHRPELLVLETATVDIRAAIVMHRSGGEDMLSPGQVALLKLFMANPHVVLSRDDIIAAAPAEASEAFDRSIDSRIVRLRRKLDTESIVTVRGAGYRFDPP